MERRIEPELLDQLPCEDPLARRSRQDLRRINSLMRNDAILAGALRSAARGRPLDTIVDLGAGDGDFLLQVAGRMGPTEWKGVKVTLLDRQSVADSEALAGCVRLGWQPQAVVADVFDWVHSLETTTHGVIITNLFLHHFTDVRLTQLFHLLSQKTGLFIAVEPRRNRWAWFCSRLVWLVRCNLVTQHDAVASVRAGFTGNELSQLWPPAEEWELTERPTGLFSHLFVAQRTRGNS